MGFREPLSRLMAQLTSPLAFNPFRVAYPVLPQDKGINIAVRPTETLPRASRRASWTKCDTLSKFFFAHRGTHFALHQQQQ